MRGRHTLAAASGMLCVLLVSGCGGGAEPQPLPRPTASFDPSESPSPTPPVMPSGAKEKTKAGAIDFVRYYVQLINHAQATGDVDALARNEAGDCVSCQRANQVIGDLYDEGGSVQGGDFVIDDIRALKLPEREAYLVEVGIHFGPQQIDWPEPKEDQDLGEGRAL